MERNRIRQERKYPSKVCEWKNDKTITLPPIQTPPQKYHQVKNHHNIVNPHFLVIQTD